MSDTKLPSGIELTPLNDAFKQNPYEALATLRENAPVYVDTDLKRYIYTRKRFCETGITGVILAKRSQEHLPTRYSGAV